MTFDSRFENHDRIDDTKPFYPEAATTLRLRLAPIGARPAFSPMTVAVRDRMVIGRSASQADIPIPGDDQISRRHCELTLDGERIYIRDLGSVNGTWINGVQISGIRPLETDDILLLGGTEMRITLLPAEAKAAGSDGRQITGQNPAPLPGPEPNPNQWNIHPQWSGDDVRPPQENVWNFDQKMAENSQPPFQNAPFPGPVSPLADGAGIQQTNAASGNVVLGFIRKLASGGYGLARTYWLYGVLVGVPGEILGKLLARYDSDFPFIIYGCLYGSYQAVVLKGIWAAAGKYAGKKIWAILARIAVVIGAIFLLILVISIVLLVSAIFS